MNFKKNFDIKNLINLEKIIPDIHLDIRYATTNNFTHKKLYALPCAYLIKEAAESLKLVQEQVKKDRDYNLLIYDGYRPFSVQWKLYKHYQIAFQSKKSFLKIRYGKCSESCFETCKCSNAPKFVNHPFWGSCHNAGYAIDLTLIKDEKPIIMPTDYDEFVKKASIYCNNLPREAIKNREYLIKVMKKHHFIENPYEWWHFDFPGFKKEYIQDIPFEKLQNI